MAHYTLKNCKYYLDGFDVSGDLNQIQLDYSAEALDNTTFGNTGKRRIPGLTDVQVTGNGYVDLDEDAQDKQVWDAIGVDNKVVTICPTDGTAGEKAYTFKALHAGYQPGESVGQVMAFSVNAMGSGSVCVKATVMENGAKTSSASGTARELGAVGATQKLYASLHVLSVSAGDTIDVVVQSDDAEGFASPTNRITFAQASAAGSEWATPIDGAILDTWYRCSWTVAGADPSISIVVVVGIQ